MNRFETTVSALTYSIILDRCRAAEFSEVRPHNRVAAFVVEQHGRMAAFLRVPLLAVTYAFDAWGILRTGRPFHRQQPAQRLRQIEAWRSSKVGPCRDFIRFYESLTVFGAYAFVHEPESVSSGPTTGVKSTELIEVG